MAVAVFLPCRRILPLNFAFELEDTLQVIAFLLFERLQLAVYVVVAAAAFVDFVVAGPRPAPALRA